jgi:preprotein translocase subunit SecA
MIYANAIEHIKALSSGRNGLDFEDMDFEDDLEDDDGEDYPGDLEEYYPDDHSDEDQYVSHPFIRPAPDASNNYAGTSRNAPCPCGSGKKYKRCHGKE